MQVKYLSANATKAAGLPMSLLISLAATSVLLNAGNRSCQNKLLPLWLMHRVTTENLGNSQGSAVLRTHCALKSGVVQGTFRPYGHKAFICIYPAYLNNKKTIAEGRRIPIDKAVENPTSTEIQDVCAAAGFNVLLEKNKMYPREWNRDVQYRGRVRIQLKQDDGNPCLPQFPTRKSVMLYAAETIPKLKTRTQKMGGSDQNLQQGEGGKKGKGKKKK
ncbi:signal recognition particle 19kDa [Columba livia]|uniref:Signal recognition particle 19 kDa protein n=1 Tax=Columba livia TaxID=8932 RepID=A0A2I0M8V6_COLLI|nr:signal recognition particle 19 kDa protein [Columba livia]PKK26112.1 signal recognition particle 19kDa [Columba livia]